MNWDIETDGMRINEELARLRGWEHRAPHPGWMLQWYDPLTTRYYRELPDIFGSNCVALEAAEWMKQRGWYYGVGYSDDGGYYAIFWREGNRLVPDGECNSQMTLSVSIAIAMGMALESEAK